MRTRLVKIQCMIAATLLCIGVMSMSAWAADSYSASSMRLLHYEGEVEILDADGQPRFVLENVRFDSGETLTTGENSTASVELDEDRIVTLDSQTSVEFIQQGDSMKMNLKEGTILLDVGKKLDQNESLDIQTSNMTVGIRGTVVYMSHLPEGDNRLQELSESTLSKLLPLMEQDSASSEDASASGEVTVFGVLEGNADISWIDNDGAQRNVNITPGKKAILLGNAEEDNSAGPVVDVMKNDDISDFIGSILSAEQMKELVDLINSESSMTDPYDPEGPWMYCGVVTLVAQSASKMYDGTALTEKDILVSYLPEGFSVDAQTGGSQLNAGTSDNPVTSFTIYNPDGEDVTSHFTSVETVSGQLVVDPVPITVWTGSAEKVYDGAPLTSAEAQISGHPEYQEVKTSGKNISYINTQPFIVSEDTDDEKTGGTQPDTDNQKSDNALNSIDIGQKDTEDAVVTQKYTDGEREVSDQEVLYGIVGETVVHGTNPLTEETREITLLAGQKLTVLINEDAGESSIEFQVEKMTEEDIPEEVLRLYADNPDLLEQACGETGWDIDKILERIGLLPAAQAALVEENSVMVRKDDTGSTLQDFTNVWINIDSDITEYDGRSLGTNEASFIPLTLDPTIIVKATGSQKNAGESTNTYEIDWGDAIEGNYIITEDLGTLTVTAAPLTVTTGSATKVYDGQPLTSTEGTIEGLAAGESASVITTGSQTNVGTSENTYTISWGSASESNYYIAAENLGTLEVTPAPLVITIDSISKVYDGTPLTGADISISGLVDGETATLTATGSLTATGTAQNSYQIDWGSADPDNYSIETEYLGTMTVTPAPLIITTGSAEKVYDGTALTCEEASISGLVAGEQASVITTGSQTEVGSSQNTYTIRWDGADENNYYIAAEELGTLTVTPAEEKEETAPLVVTVTTGSASKVYDGTALTAGEGTISGLAEGDEAVLTVTGSQTDVGTSRNTYEITWGSNNQYEYTVTENLGTLTVTPAPVTITTGSASKAYDGTALTSTDYTISGLAAGESVAVTTTGSQKDVGSSENTFTIAWGNTNPNNYIITERPGTLEVTVNDAPVTFTAGSTGRDYDGTPLTSRSVTAEGIPENLTFTASTSGSQTDAGESDNTVASYQIFDAEGKDVTSSFTNIVTVSGTLTVSPAVVTITTGSAGKAYDGTALTNAQAGIRGLAAGESVTLAATGTITETGNTKNTYSITWDNAKEGNYSVTENIGTLTVTANSEQVTLTAPSDSKIYDGTALTADGTGEKKVTASGLPEGFTMEATATGSQTDAGSCANVVDDGYVIRNAAGEDKTANFTNVTKEDGTLTVDLLPVTFDVGGYTAVYDGDPWTPVMGGTEEDFEERIIGRDPSEILLLARSAAKAAADDSSTAVPVMTGTYENDDPVELVDYDYTGDEDNPALTANYNLTGGGAVSLTFTGITDAGTYAMVPEVSFTDGKAENYTFTFTNNTLVIDPLEVFINMDNVSFSEYYDGEEIVYDGYPWIYYFEDDENDGVFAVYKNGPGNGRYLVPSDVQSAYEEEAEYEYEYEISQTATYELLGGGILDVTMQGYIDAGTYTVIPDFNLTSGKKENYKFSYSESTLVIKPLEIFIDMDYFMEHDEYEEEMVNNSFMYDGYPQGFWFDMSGWERSSGYGVNAVIKYGDDGWSLTPSYFDYNEDGTSETAGYCLSEKDMFEVTLPGYVDVGTYSVVPEIKVTAGNADNFKFTWTENAYFVIRPREVTLKTGVPAGEEEGVVYNGLVQSGELSVEAVYSYGSGYHTEQVDEENWKVIWDCGDEFDVQIKGGGTDAGEYPLTCTYQVTTGNASNYDITAKDSQMIILPAPLYVSTGSASKLYDGKPLTNDEISIDGLQNGETVTEYTATGSQTEVGSSDNTYTLKWEGTAKESNYKVEEKLGTLEVLSRDIPIKITSGSDKKVYDGTALTCEEVKVDGLPDGFTYDISTNGAQTDVGSSDNKVSFRFFDSEGVEVTELLTNVTVNAGKLEVKKLPIQINLNGGWSKSIVYDASRHFLDTVTGDNLTVVSSEYTYDSDGQATSLAITADLTGTGRIVLTSEPCIDAGEYTIVPDITFLAGKEDNYEISFIVNTLTIRKRIFQAHALPNTGDGSPSTVTYNGKTRGVTFGWAWDWTLPEASFTLSTSTHTEKLWVVIVTWDWGESFVIRMEGGGKDVGTYPYSISITYNEGVNPDNYDVTLEAETLTITPAELTVTTGGAEKVYDGEPLTNSEVTVDGLQNGETLEIEATGSQTEIGESDNTYKITGGTANVELNYTVTDNLGKLIVTAEGEPESQVGEEYGDDGDDGDDGNDGYDGDGSDDSNDGEPDFSVGGNPDANNRSNAGNDSKRGLPDEKNNDGSEVMNVPSVEDFAQPESGSESKPEPKSGAEAEPEGKSGAESEQESKSEAGTEPVNQPGTESDFKPAAESEPVNQPVAVIDPVNEPGTESEPVNQSAPVTEVKPAVEPEPINKPESEVKPAADTNTNPADVSGGQPDDNSEAESAADPDTAPTGSSDAHQDAEPETQPAAVSDINPEASSAGNQDTSSGGNQGTLSGDNQDNSFEGNLGASSKGNQDTSSGDTPGVDPKLDSTGTNADPEVVSDTTAAADIDSAAASASQPKAESAETDTSSKTVPAGQSEANPEPEPPVTINTAPASAEPAIVPESEAEPVSKTGSAFSAAKANRKQNFRLNLTRNRIMNGKMEQC